MLKKDIFLIGRKVQLEPLHESHRETLTFLSKDEKICLYSPALKLKFDDWFNKALKTTSVSDQFTFVVRDLNSKQIMGSTRFY